MEYDVGMAISRGVTEPSSSLTQESMWQMNLRSNEPIDSSQAYPERHEEPDCSYYIRTGACRFGHTCRFNHPPNRKLAIAAARMKGEYPERLGQPECQYFLKTGTCKFGSTCKFHHPKEKAGIAGRVSLNAMGYPLRPGEVECAYYIRTGQCKFGNTCKFHHPQPSNYMVPYRTSPVYSPTPNWPRASFLTSPRWQAPMLLPVYNTYTGQMGGVSSPEQTDQPASGPQRAFSSAGFYAFHRESVFPERPGQPECQFYMKTGDCKFGAVCKFHHPRERFIPAPDCMLSQIGLPLRPGEPMCIFYSRYGICKFGPSCKFDHPMGGFGYDLSGGSLTGEESVRRFLGPRQLVSGDDDVGTMGENV